MTFVYLGFVFSNMEIIIVLNSYSCHKDWMRLYMQSALNGACVL